MRTPTLTTIAAVAALAVTAVSQTTVVVPNGTAATEGASSTAYPWGRGIAPAGQIRVQYIYDSSHFTAQGITYPVNITRLRWRANGTTALTQGGTYNLVNVQMSTCPVDQALVTTTFASNHGANLATVYNSAVNVAASAGTTPNNWYVDLTLSAPFLYDPTQGDLNIDTMTDATGWVGAIGTALDCTTTGSNVSRVYNLTTYTSPTGTTQLNVGPVVEVTYTPAAGLYAGFSATPTTGVSPLLVQFTDASFSSAPGGVLSWAWDMNGDNVVDYTTQNPSHTFGCGSHSVSLTVTDASHPANTMTRTNLIVTDSLTASFTRTPTGPNTWQFTDTSTLTPTAWAWDFNGDNVTDSTVQNPTWVFPTTCAPQAIRLTATLACRTSVANDTLFSSPLSMSTLTVGNNGLTGAAVGVFFDVNVAAADGIKVCGVSVLPYSTTGAFTCDVYVTPTTYIGNDQTIALWRKVGTGSGVSVGGTSATAVLTPVAMTQPFYLSQGTYGMAVYIVPATGSMGQAYVTGIASPSNLVYSNADLTLTNGTGRATLFTGAGNTPRVWCGTLHYTKNSVNGASGYGFFGAGCAGSMGIPGNVATAEPRLGQTMTANLTNLPMNAAFFLLGFSRTTSVFGPLPFALAPFGAPGCFGRVSIDANVLIVGAGNTASYNLTVPNNAIYLGNQLFTQGLVLSTGNVLGAVTSDAAAFIIGQ